MHILQRLLNDVGRVVSVAAATARMVQSERASKAGELANTTGDTNVDLISKFDDEYNEELAKAARAKPRGPGGPPARANRPVTWTASK